MNVFLRYGFAYVFAASALCSAEDTQCSPFHYHEQTLAKMVRMELRLEQLEGIVNDTISQFRSEDSSPCRQCPDLWIPFQGSCYLFVDGKHNYFNAKSHCNELGAHLVHIGSGMENAFLKTHLSSLKASDYWMGLTDIGTEGLFKWDENNVVASFTDWYPGMPDNSGGNQDCVFFEDSMNYRWNDYQCTYLSKSVCEKEQ